MSQLDPRIEAIRQQYDLDRADFWELPQKKGTWVAKHAALEVVAVKAHIVFDAPQIIEARTEAGIAVLAVRGIVANEPQRQEWATGEASPKNNKNAYPWAMAEKRAKDRVILKLVGIHGLVYSEDEMSGSGVQDQQQPATQPPVQHEPQTVATKSSAQAKRDGDWEALTQEVDACQNLEELEVLVASSMFRKEASALPTKWKEQLRDHITTARTSWQKMPTPQASLDRQFGAPV